MDKVTLLPCPFCAWPGKLMAQDGVSWVECIDCACEGPPEDDDAQAIATWNTRATPAPDSEKLREAAERLVLLLDERCKGGFTWSPLMPGETIRAALDDTRAALGASL